MEWIAYVAVSEVHTCDHNLTNHNDPDLESDMIKEPSMQSYETAFSEILMKHSFPTIMLRSIKDKQLSEIVHRVSSVECRMISEQIQSIGSGLDVFGIPRTLYELIFLREYLYHRAETSFRVMDDDVSFLEEYGISFVVSPWLFDHKTFVGTVNYAALCDKVFKRTDLSDNPRLAFTYYEMNNLLIRYVINSVRKHKGSTSIQDVITDNRTLSTTILQIIYEQVMTDLIALQQGQLTRISHSYDMWPLRSESLMDTLETDFSDYSSLWQPCFEKILEHSKSLQQSISELCKLIKTPKQSNTNIIMNSLQAKLAEFSGYGQSNDTSTEHCIQCAIAKELWNTALELCHEVSGHIGYYLASSSYETSKMVQALKKLKRYLHPIYAVDPCVYCFRKPSFVSRQSWSGSTSISSFEMIWNCIQLELQAYKTDCFLLYRGTANLEHDFMFVQTLEDGTTTKSTASNPALVHSLSFGMSLFSGILFDKTATVFNKLRKSNMRGYAVQLPILPFLSPSDSKELKPSDLVFIPPLPSLLQLAGIGELFHPRTKMWLPSEWIDYRQYFVSGIHQMSYQQIPDFLRIPVREGVTKETVISAHNQLKCQLVVIK